MSAATVADDDRGYVGIDPWRRGLGRDRVEKPTTKFVLGILAQEQVKYATGKGRRKSNAHLADAAGMSLDTFETHLARALASPWIRIVKPRRGLQEVQLIDHANLTRTVGSDGNGQVPEPSDQTEAVDATHPANRPFPSDQKAISVGSDGVFTSVTDYQEVTEVKTTEPRSASATRGTVVDVATIAEVAAFIHTIMHALPEGFGRSRPITPRHPDLLAALAEWRADGRTDADAAEALATIGKAHRSPAGMIASHLRLHLAGEAPIPVTSTPRAPGAGAPDAGRDNPQGKPRASKPAPAPRAPVDPVASHVGNVLKWPLATITAIANDPGGSIHTNESATWVELSGPGWRARAGIGPKGPVVDITGDGWRLDRALDHVPGPLNFYASVKRNLKAHGVPLPTSGVLA